MRQLVSKEDAPENVISISMDSRGRATDNHWIERFWRTIKHGYIYLNPASDGIELYRGVKRYVEYCRTEPENDESSTKALILPKPIQNRTEIQII